jgi:hypothetical protein
MKLAQHSKDQCLQLSLTMKMINGCVFSALASMLTMMRAWIVLVKTLKTQIHASTSMMQFFKKQVKRNLVWTNSFSLRITFTTKCTTPSSACYALCHATYTYSWQSSGMIHHPIMGVSGPPMLFSR